MKRLVLIMVALVAPLGAQTTTLIGTTFRDLSGNLLTGSLCIGTTLGNPTTCQSITAGVLSPSIIIANGTYGSAWINNNSVLMWQGGNVVLSGGTLAADALFNSQFTFTVGAVNSYLLSPLGQINVLTCNGNAVVAPNQPTVGALVWIINTSTTTACSGTVNFGGTVLLQGAASTTFAIPAKNTAQMVFTSANGWVIGHIGT